MRFTQCLAFIAALLAQTEIAKALEAKKTAIASAFSGIDGEVSASFGEDNMVLFHVTETTTPNAAKDAVARFLSIDGWEKKFDAKSGTFSWYTEGTSSYLPGVEFGITIDDDMAADDVIVLKEEKLEVVTTYKVYVPQN